MQRTATVLAATLALVTTAALSACSDSDSGDSKSSENRVLAENGPLREPADEVWNDICHVATAAQVTKLGLTQFSSSTDGERTTACMWQINGDSYNISVQWQAGAGVAHTIKTEGKANRPDFQETTIDGQKSAFFRTTEDSDDCLGYVGMHPELVFLISATHDSGRGEARPKEACDLTIKYAKEFVPNIADRNS